MICKKCANIFSDDLSACPDCGEPVRSAGTENQNTDTSDVDRLVSLALSEEESYDVPLAEEPSEEYTEEEEYTEDVQEESYEETQQESDPEQLQVPTKSDYKRTGKKEKVVLRKMGKKERGAFNFIIALMVVVFISMGAVLGVSLTSDFFESDSTAIKTVALTGLTSAETEEFEGYLEKISAIAYEGFDKEKATVVDIMNYMRPDSPGGLYSKFYSKPEIIASKADPNARFMNKNEDFSFFEAKAEEIDSILTAFGLEPDHNINEKNYYYYKDKYYFANLKKDILSGSIVAEISSSKRIQNGSYYVECSFYDEAAEGEDKNLLQTYIILDKEKDAETEETKWHIDSVSHEPVFDENGFMIEKTTENNDLSYEIKKESFKNVTKDGTVYSEYTVEYPVFEGTTEGEKATNLIVSTMIESYKTSEAATSKAYKKYIKKGGEKDDLPHIVKVTARVTYNRNGYISVVQEISKDKPDSLYKTVKKNIGGKKIKVATLPEKSFETYTFKVDTGEFVPMGDIITAKREVLEEVLYRIYKGYSYKGLLKKNPTDSDDVPEDSKGLGAKIYESSSAMGDTGYVFCYVNSKGYTETVTIPYTVNRVFAKDFKKLEVKEEK